MLLNTLNKALKDEFQAEIGFKYATPLDSAELYQISLKHIKTHLQSGHRADAVYFRWFDGFALLHLEYSAYVLYEFKDNEKAQKHLSNFMGYSELILNIGSSSCDCLQGEAPFIISNKATFMASTLLLTHQTDDFTIASKNLIDSLNGKNCIIKKGYRKATISWFVLKLFSLYTQQEITLHPLLQPKLNDTYNKILKEWDTTDNKTLDFDIEALCELHLSQAANDLADVDAHYRDDIYNLRYRELFIPALYTLPYEVLVWLKLRELKGLKNPKTFTHPLMNTPIAKMFLNIKEPLPYPKELPYAKELLEKLQEQCPDVEIPQWLEGVSGSVNKRDNTIGDDLFIK